MVLGMGRTCRGLKAQGSRLKPPPEVWPRRARKPRRTRMLAAAWYESVGTRQVTIPAAGESEILRGRVLRTQCDVSNQRSAAEGSRILNLDIQVTHLAHRAGQDSLYLVRTTCLKFRSNMKRNRSCGQAADIRASAPRNAAAPLLVIQCRLPPQSPSIHRPRMPLTRCSVAPSSGAHHSSRRASPVLRDKGDDFYSVKQQEV